MATFWRFLGPVFSASHAQQISDLHSKFALRPHHVSKYGRHPTCDRRDKARKKDRKKQDENIYVRILLCRATIKTSQVTLITPILGWFVAHRLALTTESNTYRKFREVWTSGFWHMCERTDIQSDIQTRSSQYLAPLPG